MPIGVAIVESQIEFARQFGDGGRIEKDTRTQGIQIFNGAVVANIRIHRQNLGWLRNPCPWESATFNHVSFSEREDYAEFSSILLRLVVLYDDGRSDSGNHRRAFPNTSRSNRTHQMGTNPLIGENPDLDDLRRLEQTIYEFNVQATGISDGRPFASFLRDAEKAVIGGISGWTWGKTCFIGHLFVPAELRKQGYGTRLVQAVEAEAINRGCDQIVVRTHDFQAPQFYINLGFAVIARIPDYPVGHQEITMIKLLTTPKVLA
jgi:GNAT superfamily N-acetyltransferase